MESSIRQAKSFIEQYDFFQYLYLLEQKDLLKNIKLTSSSKLGFSATDISGNLEIHFMGLCGVDSPLPHYILYKASQDNEEGKILRDFLDIFNNRLYHLFYLALKKYQPAVNIQPYRKYLTSISEGRVKSRVGLKALLREYLRDLKVEVKTLIPNWREIKIEESYILGENTILGSRLWDYSSSLKIEIGPMRFDRALILKNNKELIKLIRSYCPSDIRYKLCFLIHVPENISCLMLGWMCWLGKPQTSLVQIML